MEGFDPYFGSCADECFPAKGCRGHVGDRRDGHVVERDVQAPPVWGVLELVSHILEIRGISRGHPAAQTPTEQNDNKRDSAKRFTHELNPSTPADSTACGDVTKR